MKRERAGKWVLGSRTSLGGLSRCLVQPADTCGRRGARRSLPSLNSSGCLWCFLCLVRRRRSEPEKTLTCWCPQAARSRNCELGSSFTGSWARQQRVQGGGQRGGGLWAAGGGRALPHCTSQESRVLAAVRMLHGMREEGMATQGESGRG